MKHITLITLGAVVLSAGAIETALAQYPPPSAPRFRRPIRGYQRPTVSPYLNLLGRNRTRGFAGEYLLRVRPEIQFRRANDRLARSVRDLNSRLNTQQRRLRQSGTSQLSATGHRTSFLNPTQFMNYSSYYQFNGR